VNYARIYLRNLKGLFTWHSSEPVGVGDRVVVNFRNRKRIGIVVDTSAAVPDFPTQEILEIWNQSFINPSYIELAKQMSADYFCSLEKVLSLMVPEKFLQQQKVTKREITYILGSEERSLRGEKQKAIVELLRRSEVPVHEAKLRDIASASTIKSLVEKDIIAREEGKLLPALKQDVLPTKQRFELTVLQQEALESIQDTDKPSLLWGVTGSGKTEIYKHLAKEALNQDKQTLLLLPEIALTSQLIAEFRGVFGDRLAVWHSNLSVGEKVQEWERVRTGEAKILIGARSAILVPMPGLGLVILDEEHEWTYKNEFAPRFLTHDIAELLATNHRARLVFGSATPRLESLHQTDEDHWNLVRLDEQVFKTAAPTIQIVNMGNETKQGNYSPVSEKLKLALEETLAKGRQAVLFLNKRGFAGATMCRHCGQTFECPNCSHNMKVHGYHDPRLICHICAHMEGFPMSCPQCHKSDFKFQGWGTQQVERWFLENFPGKKILRADRDTVSRKHDFENLMQQFYHHEADVLLGTQMVAKGLDFAKVDLVGIILADVGLNLPDFRAEERVFQLLTQVSGRAGRRETAGQILVQTFRPEEPLFKYLSNQDTAGFLEAQKLQRKAHAWPPYQAVAKLTIHHPSKATAFAQTKNLFDDLERQIADKKLAIEAFWVPAFIPRTHNKYWFHIILKTQEKSLLQQFLSEQGDLGSVKVDLSPGSLL